MSTPNAKYPPAAATNRVDGGPAYPKDIGPAEHFERSLCDRAGGLVNELAGCQELLEAVLDRVESPAPASPCAATPAAPPVNLSCLLDNAGERVTTLQAMLRRLAGVIGA